MAENAQKRRLRRKRFFSIAAWTFVVLCSVVDIVAHRERTVGLHGFLTILYILVGIMCIFNEVTGLLREPQ